MTAEFQELEERLLALYPEAQKLVNIIKEHGYTREVSIRDTPYGELVLEQEVEEGPFWTIVREDSHRFFFRVMSFGLNQEKLSATFRRRDGMEGLGKSYKGPEVRSFLKENINGLCDIYRGWFVEDRRANQPIIRAHTTPT